MGLNLCNTAKYAPVVLFVYNRPWHTQRTIEALQANVGAKDTTLYIFSDHPKDQSASEGVNAVRKYIRTFSGFGAINIVERTINYGLAKSIIDGVTHVCAEHGRVIVMEDDLVTSPYFLQFMNDGLLMYEHDDRVASIHGYVYPVKERLPETFFLRGADCWGWATWSRAWDLFEPDGSRSLKQLEQQKLKYQFDLDGTYPYTRMLRNQIKGKNNSWAIRWYASTFLLNKFTLYPGQSLVQNIGMDGSGTHCASAEEFFSAVANSPIKINLIEVEDHQFARKQIIQFQRRARKLAYIRFIRKFLIYMWRNYMGNK